MAFHYGWEILLEIPDRAYLELSNALMPYNPALKRRVPISGSAARVMAALKGWPDLFMGHRGARQAIAIELKTKTGAVRASQKEKLPLLNDCGIPAEIWRPGTERAKIVLAGVRHGT